VEHREKKYEEKERVNIKIQKLIRKRREEGEHRQVLSQEIMGIKKSTEEQLEKKLDQLRKTMGSGTWCLEGLP
jgi:low affinity Fe/Cu permease